MDLKSLGITLNLEKRKSISFIDGFLSCGRKTLLDRILHLPKKECSESKVFGSCLHKSLNVLNILDKDKQLPCETCQYKCHVYSPEWEIGVKRVKPGECPIHEILNNSWEEFFTKDIVANINDKYDAKDKKGQGDKILTKYKNIAPNLVFQAFRRFPNSEVLFTEGELNGTIGKYSVYGYVDLIRRVTCRNQSKKVVLIDYKSRKSKPNDKSFPARQASYYKKMVDSPELTIDTVGVLYLVTTGEGSVIEEYIDMTTEANKKFHEHTIRMLEEDIVTVNSLMSQGLFLRNRKDTYCPCEMAEYCENDDLAIETFKQIKEKQKNEDHSDGSKDDYGVTDDDE